MSAARRAINARPTFPVAPVTRSCIATLPARTKDRPRDGVKVLSDKSYKSELSAIDGRGCPLPNGCGMGGAGSTMTALRLEGISKHFGAIHALNDVSLSLQRGEVLGLMGDN